QWVDEVCDRYEAAWQSGWRPRLEDYLGEAPEPQRTNLLHELIRLEVEYGRRQGEALRQGEYLSRFPGLDSGWVAGAWGELALADSPQTMDQLGREPSPKVPVASPPTHIGRYRILKVLGQGGFGLVYLAHDEQLQRLAAIKVPHRKLVERPEDAEAYLTEARNVANLDHPHIVPVFDVGSTEDCPCYVVSKYIDGTDLAKRLKQSRLSMHEAVSWWRRWPRHCTTPTSKVWCIGTSSRPTSCSTGAANPSWRISGWPCASRTWARGRAMPGRLPT